MKLSIECDAESKTKIDKEIEIAHNDRTYIFYPDENGFINRIKIIAPIDNPKKFYSEITATPNEDVKAHFHVKTDVELWTSIIKEFQELESVLGLTFNLKSIKWNAPRRDLIFDSEEEREKAKIYNFKSWFEYRDPPYQTTKADLENVVQNKSDFSHLIVAMSFFREGINDKNAFKYINAFFNFYFILEGLYGKGKTKNYQIEQEFKNSEEFKQLVDWALDESRRNKPADYKKIGEMLSRMNKQIGIKSFIELIVKTRGELHHFTNNPNRPQGTPFTHQEYSAIAHMTMKIAMHAILRRMEEVNQYYLSQLRTE